MKQWKILICLVLVLALMLPAAAAEGSTYQPGVYTGTGIGFHGAVEVEVEVSETQILNVIVTAASETKYVGSTALELLPDMVVENQSLADIVSGATFSSNAFNKAVAEALKTAGASDETIAALKANVITGSIPEDQEADLLIIGAGAAGLAAAIDASDAGLDVILIEKRGMTGGSSRLSGGCVYGIGSEFEKTYISGIPVHTDYTPEDVVAHYEAYCGVVRSPELMLEVLNRSGETLDKYAAEGYTIAYPTQNCTVEHPTWLSLCTTDAGAGAMTFLTRFVENRNVDLRLNTRALQLILDENGAVIGAQVECPAGQYEISAKKTLLATGGFTYNDELMAQYCAGDYENSIRSAAAGGTGDGHIMGLEAGGYIVGEGALGITCVASRVGTEVHLWNPTFHVNAKGEKIMRSDEYYPMAQQIINAQENGLAFTIYDADYGMDVLEQYVAAGMMMKADTIEELAQKLGIDPEGLAASVAENNRCAAEQTTDELGSRPGTIVPIAEAPFYGCRRTAAIMGTIPGLAVDNRLHVLHEDGSVIENLYAAGEVMFGNVINDIYPMSGTAVTTAMVTGRMAAEDAAEELN